MFSSHYLHPRAPSVVFPLDTDDSLRFGQGRVNIRVTAWGLETHGLWIHLLTLLSCDVWRRSGCATNNWTNTHTHTERKEEQSSFHFHFHFPVPVNEGHEGYRVPDCNQVILLTIREFLRLGNTENE